MENVAPILFLLLRLLCMASSHARSYDTPRYDTAYACEGKVLKIECREGELIHLIRANYGRFSITICNDHGNTEWSVNCMSPKSLRVLHSKCSLQPNCTIPASTSMFGDPCPGTLKYLEAHFRCVPATTTTTTSRPNPPWLLTSQPSVWTSSRMTSLRPPVRGGAAEVSTTANVNKLPWPSMDEIGSIVTPVPLPAITTSAPRESTHEQTITDAEHRPPVPVWKTTGSSQETHPSTTSLTDQISSTTIAPTWRPAGEHLHYCSPLSTRGLYWNWTRPNEVDIQPCPGGANGVARWRCVQNGANVGWHGDSPDLSECRSVWLTSLDSRIDEGESLVNIANDLSQVTSSNTLYGGDMMTTTDIIKKITDKMSKNIETFPDPSQREAIVTEQLQSVVRTTSNLIDSAQTAGWGDLSHLEQMRVATSLLIGLEENAFLLADTVIREKTVVQTVKNILLSVRVMRTQNLESEVFPVPGERDSNMDGEDHGDQLIVPKGAMIDNSEGGLVRIVFAAFQRLEEILVPDLDGGKQNGSRVVNSRIISASLGKGRHIQFSQWVRITLAHIRTENVSNPVCVFWDYTMSAWSQEGCEIVTTNKTHSVCRCNHLTNFAILMDIHDEYLDPSRQLALQIITYVGCLISIVCLLLAVITFHLFRVLKSDRNTIHKNLCFCLLIAEVLFLFGIGQTDKPIACGIVAGLLHFVFLTAFAWMFLEGFQLYIMLTVIETERSRMRWHYLFAYGAPLLIVCVSCVVDPLSYGTDKYCWLRADNFFIFSFVGPVIAVILANLVFLSMAIYSMCQHSATTVTVKSKEQTRLANAKSWLRGAIVLVFLLGVTWTFGLLYLNEGTVVMAYIFTILNSLQGLFIFLFHCLYNEKVRKEYRKCMSWLPWCGSETYDSPDAKDRRVSSTSASSGTHAHTLRIDPAPMATPSHSSHANGHNTMHYRSGREIVEDRSNYAVRSSTLGNVRQQAYTQGPNKKFLVTELDQRNGTRAATLQLAGRKRKERHPSESRRSDMDDPVYEEIRPTSDVSDEDMRRNVSRQSQRSYGDHSPLIPSPHNPSYPPYPAYPYGHGHGTLSPHPHVTSQSPRSMQSLHSVHSMHSLHQSAEPYMYAPRHDR